VTGPPDPARANLLAAAHLFDELAASGLRHVALAPGSRSSPLALAAALHPGLRTWVHADERSAAFFALGVGKATGSPAAFVCTSGTAAANAHPAVLESAASLTPLLLLTADRPPEARHAGSPQTVDQVNLYGRAARWFLDLPPPGEAPDSERTCRSAAAWAAARALGPLPGPVHLNLPFREPLVPADEAAVTATLETVYARRRTGPRVGLPRQMPDGDALDRAAAALASSARPVVVAGPGAAATLPEAAAIGALANALGAPLLADVASGLRFGPTAAEVSGRYDAYLRSPRFARVRADVILRFGGAPTSKVLAQYANAAATTLLVQTHAERRDPDLAADLVITGAAVPVCEVLAAAVSPVAGAWKARFEAAEECIAAVFEKALRAPGGPGEGTAVAGAFAALPAGAAAVLSNSMPVRDADAFAAPRPEPLRVVVNRGANGVDGITSTAAGVAAALETPTLAVIGDLAFLHDLGGLLVASRRALPLVLLLIDNDGGGIFSFLPVAGIGPTLFEPLFGTPHGLDLAHAGALFGWEWFETPAGEAGRAVAAALAARRPAVIRVRSERAANVSAHRALAAECARAVDDLAEPTG
jgi:2-succinyl-5-enolpyruvyl-6-hydroxy-3-cyclohexene-1-carboxylate synthase